MTTVKDDKSPDESGGTTKESAAAAAERESRTRWIVGILVALIAALVPIAVALISRSGTETEPPLPTTAITTTVPSLGPTPDSTITPVSAGSPQPTDPVNSQNPPEPGASAAYLTDLDYSTDDDDNYVEVGLASIAGKRYKKSFRVHECLSPEITVVLPQGLTHLSGVVGYDDESGSKDDSYKVQIEATSDADPSGDDVQFTRLDVLAIPSGGRRAVPFSEELSPGTTGVRLSAVKYACSTMVSWGDPRIS
jgi:hypothetical protein